MQTTRRSIFVRIFISLFLSYAFITSLSAPLLTRVVRASPSGMLNPGKSRPALSRANSAQSPERRTGELLVRFRSGVAQQNKDTVLAAHGTRRKNQLRGESIVEKLEVLGGQDVETVALQLSLSPDVEFVEPNFLIKKDQVL